jgi:hypothetical protein
MFMLKRYSSKTVLVWGALAAALLAAGCGDSSSEASPQSLTKAQFIKRGDAICQKNYNTRSAEELPYIKKGADAFSKADLERLVLKITAPSYRHDVEGLEALTERSAPEGDEEQLQELVDVFDATVTKIEKNPGITLGGAGPTFREIEKLTQEYGFEVCGKA